MGLVLGLWDNGAVAVAVSSYRCHGVEWWYWYLGCILGLYLQLWNVGGLACINGAKGGVMVGS